MKGSSGEAEVCCALDLARSSSTAAAHRGLEDQGEAEGEQQTGEQEEPPALRSHPADPRQQASPRFPQHRDQATATAAAAGGTGRVYRERWRVHLRSSIQDGAGQVLRGGRPQRKTWRTQAWAAASAFRLPPSRRSGKNETNLARLPRVVVCHPRRTNQPWVAFESIREMPNLGEGTRAPGVGRRFAGSDRLAGARLGRVRDEGTWQLDQRVDRGPESWRRSCGRGARGARLRVPAVSGQSRWWAGGHQA